MSLPKKKPKKPKESKSKGKRKKKEVRHTWGGVGLDLETRGVVMQKCPLGGKGTFCFLRRLEGQRPSVPSWDTMLTSLAASSTSHCSGGLAAVQSGLSLAAL